MMMMLAGSGALSYAQDPIREMNAVRLDEQAEWFEQSVDNALANDQLKPTIDKDEFEALVDNFEIVSDWYKDRVKDNDAEREDVLSLLSRALMIEEAMAAAPATMQASRDWMQIKQTLDTIAQNHGVKWVWTLKANPYWTTAELKPIIRRIESSADRFENTMDYALDSTKLDSKVKDAAEDLADDFESHLDSLRSKVNNGEAITVADMEKVAAQGMLLDAFIATHKLPQRVVRDWAMVRVNLRELAQRSNIAWTWNVKPVVSNR